MKKRRYKKRLARPSSAELEEFRAFLGPLAEDYTDGELRQLRLEMHAMAEILLDLFITKNSKKVPTIRF